MQFLDLPFWETGIRGLMAMLCEIIYSLMGFFYELFNIVAKSNILTSEDVQPIYQRVTMILTIVMVFYVTFQFVKYVVQPDGLTDKEKGAGNIVYKMVIVIVLIAFVPKIFEMAYKVQNVIINKNVISKVILGPQASIDEENLGPGFATSVFGMFYYVDAENANKECYEGATCEQIVAKNLGNLQTEGKLSSLSLGLNETDNSDEPLITFEFGGFLPVIVGGAIVWILMLYCVDVGVRWAQLLYLQLIAPIPILGYMSPKKDGIFQKWIKQCFTTYLDLFLRVAIINLMLLLCHTLLQSKLTGGIVPEGTTGMMATLAYVVLIMGVMLFAHKAPKMLAELFPKGGAASGNFGLKATERVAPEVARVAGAALGSTRFLGGAASRYINRRIRNKANNAHHPWTKEGQEQTETYRKNRSKARNLQHNYDQDTKDNQRLRNRVTDAQVAAGKEKVKTARNEYEAAKKSGNQNEIDRTKANLDREAANYAKMMRERNAPIIDAKQNVNNARGNLAAARRELTEAQKSGNQQAIAAATQKVQAAEQKYQDEANKFRNDASKSGGRVGDINEATKKVEDAKNELNQAIQSGDQEKIDAARNKLANAEINLESQAQRYSNTMNSDFATQKAELDNAWSQVAQDNNTKYRSEFGAAAWGAIAGAATGAAGGFKAKKLEEIIPKAKEGWKNDVKNIQELNKYYDNGGDTSFIGGTIDRTVAQIEKSVGIDTAYTRLNLENQSLERNIKEIDSSISRIDNVKKEFDATEDRLKSKIDDNKVTAKEDTDISAKSAGTITVKKGENYADISRRYRAAEKSADAISEAASKELQDKESKLGINKDAIINKYSQYSGGTLTAQEQQEYQLYQEYQQAKVNAEQKSQEAVAAKRASQDVDKYITRAIMTEMIKDKNFRENKDGKYDGVAIQSLSRDYNEIEIARQDPKLRSYLMGTLTSEDYNAFMSVNFVDYDQMDRILTELANAKSTLTMEKQTKQDQKHRNETSKVTQSQKAANDYSGNSGK